MGFLVLALLVLVLVVLDRLDEFHHDQSWFKSLAQKGQEGERGGSS